MAVKLWYSANEAARLAGLNPQTIRRWAKLDLVPGYRLVGKRHVFMRDAFDPWLEEQRRKQELEAA